MPATPQREGRSARSGKVFPSQALGENVRTYRILRDLSQQELAERMTELGHSWTRATSGEVERNARHVNVDELSGLALSLGVTIGQLLDPTGPDHGRSLGLDLGLEEAPDGTSDYLGPHLAHLWVHSRVVVRLFHGGPGWTMEDIELDVAEEPPARAQRALEELRTNGPVRPRREREAQRRGKAKK